MTLDDARNIATVAAALVAVVSVLPLFRNLRASQLSLRSRVYFETLALLEGSDGGIRELRHVLEAEIRKAKDSGKQFDILSADDGIRAQVDKLARAYDKVGLLVKHGGSDGLPV